MYYNNSKERILVRLTSITAILIFLAGLILEVNNLDSIKNAEIVEIKNLDNDSTIKLFYKLICE